MILLADLSHWNDPNLSRLYTALKAMNPEEEPGIIVKVSDGTVKHDDGIDKAKRGEDAGFKNIGPYHFHRPGVSQYAQSDTFLEQWIKYPFTIRHTGDFEKTEVAPTSNYERDVAIWYNLVDDELKAPGILYSGLSFITTYFLNPAWHIHPLWLSQPPLNSNYKYLIGSPTIPLPWLLVTIHQESFYNFLGTYFGDAGNKHIDLNKAYWLPKPGTGIPNPTPNPDPIPVPTRRAKVVVNALNVRSGPGIDHPSVGFLSKGDVVDILESSSSPTAVSEWVRHGKGWSAHHIYSSVYMQDL